MVRILLADDDSATLEFFRRSLTSEGYEVITVQDGQEALDCLAASAGTFDVLITDVEMPGIDGIELVKLAVAAQAGLKVLLVSGFEGGMDRATKIVGAKVKALTKPLTLDQIRSEVKALLG